MRTNWGVLISGNGSTLQSVLDATQVAVVISSKKLAYGILRAKRAGVPVEVIPKEFLGVQNREKAEGWILETLARYKVEKVFLAGYMRIVSAKFIEKFKGRIFNVHPSLLPRYKGLDALKQAMDAGEHEAGVSLHHVTVEMDSGELVFQKKFEIPNHRETDLCHLFLHIQEQRAIREGLRRIQWQDKKQMS